MSKKKQNQFLLLIPKISSSPVSYCYPQNFERPFVFSPQSPLVRSIAHSLSLSLSPSLASTLSLVHCDPAKWTRYASKLFHHWQRQREVSRRETLGEISGFERCKTKFRQHKMMTVLFWKPLGGGVKKAQCTDR
uniref:Uncharacterized protein n=1 Tax=Opuntia streptacantha TaxID=393608 RepID=A0A7C9CRN6_OPUST